MIDRNREIFRLVLTLFQCQSNIFLSILPKIPWITRVSVLPNADTYSCSPVSSKDCLLLLSGLFLGSDSFFIYIVDQEAAEDLAGTLWGLLEFSLWETPLFLYSVLYSASDLLYFQLSLINSLWLGYFSCTEAWKLSPGSN